MNRSHPDENRYYELRVIPRPSGAYGLAVVETHPDNGAPARDVLIARIWGDAMRAVIDEALAAVRRAGARANDLRSTRKKPFRIREEDAVRLGVLFLGIKPLRKLTRIEAIWRQVRNMELEELYYWYSKMAEAEDPARARRACRALRILMAEE